MPRYIDAEKLLEYLEKEAESDDVKYSFIGAGVQATINEIKKFPLEDVKPVIHAHWIGGDYGDWFCSECDSVLRFYGEPEHLRYCYRCGAKMDAEVGK